MLELDPDDLDSSISNFMKNYTVLDLLNHGLLNQSLMKEILSKNNVKMISSRLPGVIVQVYLLMAKKFGFDVFGPLTGDVRETLSDNVNFLESDSSQIEAVLENGDIKTEVIETGKVYEMFIAPTWFYLAKGSTYIPY